MSKPKRHHWWPQLQSGHWTNADGYINVTRADGSTFRAPPSKIGVEGELYTRYELAGEKDLTIEHWFGEQIESPFVQALERLSTMRASRLLPCPRGDPTRNGSCATWASLFRRGSRRCCSQLCTATPWIVILTPC